MAPRFQADSPTSTSARALALVGLILGLGGCASSGAGRPTAAPAADGVSPSSSQAPRRAEGVSEPIGERLKTADAKQSGSRPAAHGPTLAVRVDDPALADEFNNIFATGDLYLAGWPTEEGFKRLAARGVKRIVALKTPDEVMHARGFDPRAAARRLGMELIVLPVQPGTYSSADVDAFAQAINASNGPVLVHCGTASTSAMVWSGYLAARPGATVGEVMESARAAGLLEGPMTESAVRVATEIIRARTAAPSVPSSAAAPPKASPSAADEK